jgi:hypothetical protein
MSRSLHTQKYRIRAARRLARPFSKRRSEAEILRGWKESETPRGRPRLPITWQKPLPGMLHPASEMDVRAFLKNLGPASVYGLSAIRFRRESAVTINGMTFAEYVMPGEIRLFAVPSIPWNLPFCLSGADRMSFEYYGALVDVDPMSGRSTVHWNPAGLKRFFLHEVLAHELGHHTLQHRRCRRLHAACRRSDHERRATLESRRAIKTLSIGIAC